MTVQKLMMCFVQHCSLPFGLDNVCKVSIVIIPLHWLLKTQKVLSSLVKFCLLLLQQA